MSALALKLLALSASFMIAFPAGWCCLERTDRVPEQSSSQHARCDHCLNGHDQRPLSDNEDEGSRQAPHVPQQPRYTCCCLHEAVPVVSNELLLQFAALPERTVELHVTGDWSFVSPLRAASDISDPPLHVLQCVWLC